MSDDIVDRLRNSHGQGCTCSAWSYSECGCIDAHWAEMYIEEAAKEITRLRHELTLTKKWRDNYKLAFERCKGKVTHSEMLRKSMEEVRREKD